MIRSKAIAAALLALFAAAPAFADKAAGFRFSAQKAGDRKALWAAVMTHFYGPYDKVGKCWPASGKNDDICMRPLRLDSEGGQLFLIASGSKQGSDCHACSGFIGLIVLGRSGGDLILDASNTLVEGAGAWGSAPGEAEFSVRRLSTTTHGWTMRTGYTAQGITTGGEVIYGIEDGKVVDLGYIPTFVDTCGYDPAKCHSYDFDLDLVPGSGAAYDVELTVAADSDRPPGEATVRIPFDVAKKKYELPAALDFLRQ